MKSFLILLATCVSLQSHATGSVYCSVDDENVKIEVDLTNGRIMGNQIVEKSALVLEIKKTSIVGLKTYTFEKNRTVNEIPYWFNFNDQMKFAAYAEPETDAKGHPLDFWSSLTVIVDTTLKQDSNHGYYSGTYTVIQSANVEGPGVLRASIEGYIKCEYE